MAKPGGPIKIVRSTGTPIGRAGGHVTLTCGIFSCPNETEVGAVVYTSNHYRYEVALDDAGDKQLVRVPVELGRDGRANA